MKREARMTAFGSFLIPLLLLLPCTSLGEEIYIWTDEHGVKHIEDQPPRNIPQGNIEMETYPSDEAKPALKGTYEAGKSPPSKPETHELEQKKALEKAQEKKQQAAGIEKARREYEEAKESEAHYRIRDRNLDTKRTHYLWRQSQGRLEDAKRRLEALENLP